MGARPLMCVEQRRQTHAGAARAGECVLEEGCAGPASHLSTLPSAFFSSWGQHDGVGADGVMVAMSWASCGWRREQRRLKEESHCQLQASNFGATAGAETGASEDSQQQDGNRDPWLFQLLSGFGLTVADWLCLQPSSALILSQSLCPPAEVGSGRQQPSGHMCSLPRAAFARAADGAWVSPSEMI